MPDDVLNAVSALHEVASPAALEPLVPDLTDIEPIHGHHVIDGAALAFLVSFDEVVISLFLVGPRLTTLPVEVFRYVQDRADPQAAALSVVLIALSVGVMLLIERALGLRRVLEYRSR